MTDSTTPGVTLRFSPGDSWGADTGEHSAEITVAGAVFDCDGLLVDSESIWLQMLTEWLTEHRLPADDAEQFLGLSVHDTATRLAAAAGADADTGTGEVPAGDSRTLVAELTSRYSALLDAGVSPMPGAVTLITSLARHVPVAVASNGLRHDVTAMLEEAGLLDVPDTICTLEDVIHGKPAPDLYLTAVARLGIPAHLAVAFEDSPAGAEAARAAGLAVVGVNHSPQVTLPATYRLSSLRQVTLNSAPTS